MVNKVYDSAFFYNKRIDVLYALQTKPDQPGSSRKQQFSERQTMAVTGYEVEQRLRQRQVMWKVNDGGEKWSRSKTEVKSVQSMRLKLKRLSYCFCHLFIKVMTLTYD